MSAEDKTLFRTTGRRDVNHRAADIDRCRHVARKQPAQDRIERPHHVVERLVPTRLRPDASERLDIARPEHEGRLEREPQQRVLGFPLTRAHIVRPRSVLSVPSPET